MIGSTLKKNLALVAAAMSLALPTGMILSGCGGGGSSNNSGGGSSLPRNLPSTRFTANVPISGGRRALLNMSVRTNGQATATLVLSDAQTNAILTTIDLTGSVNLDTRAFTLNGTYQDNGQPVTVSVSGTLPGGLGGGGPLTVNINGQDVTGTITTGDSGGVVSVVPTLTGSAFNDGRKFLYIQVGDTGQQNYSQGYLTFDLADFPARSNILYAGLTISQGTLVGNPQSLGTLYLEPITFNAMPSVVTGALASDAIGVPLLPQHKTEVTQAVKAAFDAGRRPQFRLRFHPNNANGDNAADYVPVSQVFLEVVYSYVP